MIDIDIINLILKYISINNKLPRYENKLSDYRILNAIYYYLGYKEDKEKYKKDFNYFTNNQYNINIAVRNKYLRIFQAYANILNKFIYIINNIITNKIII